MAGLGLTGRGRSVRFSFAYPHATVARLMRRLIFAPFVQLVRRREGKA